VELRLERGAAVGEFKVDLDFVWQDGCYR
jgi:hypothetical protein